MATLVRNKKAALKYELLKRYEAGVAFSGTEVKSLRNKQGSLDGSHITIRGSEAYWVGGTIPPYQPANIAPDYDPTRNRRLLLTKKEIGELAGVEKQKGLTIVPISVYSKGRVLKMEIAVARGKKKHDKRETLKERQAKRRMDRVMKEH